jgi:phosphatidylinositol glycan class B
MAGMKGGTSISTWSAWVWGPIQRSEQALPAGYRSILLAIMIACFALRLGMAWRLPNIHHADEIYQVAEQAHHSLHGYGIVPWEFRTASRAAILPTLVEPIFRLNVTATTHRLLQSALFCALSLIPVWVAFHWGSRLYGLAGGVLSAAIMAIWFELVYFAPKATADAVCSYFLLAGVFFARPGAPSRATFGAGFCLLLALAIRVQIAPAVALAVLLALTIGGRARTSALLAGAGAAVVLAGIVEWRWWGTPLQGQIGYLVMEFTRHSSQFFAQEPPIFYVKQYILMYGAALPLIAFLIYRGTRSAPVLLVTAVAVIVPFHFVGHKEYRFVIAGLPMLVLLMGLGASDLMARVEPVPRRSTLALLIGGWLVAMLAVSFGDTYRPLWTRHGNHVLAFEQVGQQPDACGIALVGIRWWQTPGYSGLGRDVPIYEIDSPHRAERLLSAANYVLQATKAAQPPAPYEPWREYTRPVQYLYRRPGGCVPDPPSQVREPPGIPGVE